MLDHIFSLRFECLVTIGKQSPLKTVPIGIARANNDFNNTDAVTLNDFNRYDRSSRQHRKFDEALFQSQLREPRLPVNGFVLPRELQLFKRDPSGVELRYG